MTANSAVAAAFGLLDEECEDLQNAWRALREAREALAENAAAFPPVGTLATLAGAEALLAWRRERQLAERLVRVCEKSVERSRNNCGAAHFGLRLALQAARL